MANAKVEEPQKAKVKVEDPKKATSKAKATLEEPKKANAKAKAKAKTTPPALTPKASSQTKKDQQQQLIQHLMSFLVHPLWLVFWHVCISTFVSNHRLLDSGASGKQATKVVLQYGTEIRITRKDRRAHAQALQQSEAYLLCQCMLF